MRWDGSSGQYSSRDRGLHRFYTPDGPFQTGAGKKNSKFFTAIASNAVGNTIDTALESLRYRYQAAISS